jgi:hypothetical protein
MGEAAAILTALTFSAIIFLADRKSNDRASHEGTQIMFLAAFVSLATAAYLYAAVAADEGEGPRTAFEAFSASLAFAIALQLLFLGIVQLMRQSEYGSAATFTAQVSKWFVGPAIFAFMASTAVGAVELYASSSAAYQSAVAYVCMALFLALLIWLGVSASPWGRTRMATIRPTPARWAGGCIVVIAIASALCLVWAETPRNQAMPAFTYVGLMVLLLVATLGFSAQLADTGPAGGSRA